MKLIWCKECNDMFKLTRDEMRYCKCRRVWGRYIDRDRAEVSSEAISVAIANDAIKEAAERMQWLHREDAETPKAAYEVVAAIRGAYVRPNEGNGNPRTQVIRSADSGPAHQTMDRKDLETRGAISSE
jgi:hypothetical protein